MSPDELRLILHSRLGSEERLEIGWSPRFVGADDQSGVRDLRCMEVRADNLDDDRFDEATLALTEVAGKLCRAPSFAAYLVLVEDRLLPKSLIRSHKALFQRGGQIKQGAHVEHEVERDEGWSFFIGMAPITEQNMEECLSLAHQFYRAFILLAASSMGEGYGRAFLESLVPCLSIKETIWINYMKLVPRVCADGPAVLSMGFSDPRGDIANLRLFFHRRMADQVREALRVVPAGEGSE